MIILKNFKVYNSALIGTSSVLFLKDELGADWYESQKLFSDSSLKFVFNSEGVIISLDYDVSKLWPVNNSVAEISVNNLPDGVNINGGWIFDGEQITARVYDRTELIMQAEAKRDPLMMLATASIAPLQDAVDIGDATDEERASLTAWKKYRIALNRLDLSAVPDITWPEIPA